nr:TIGR04255 family protein [Microbacterium proteolyticum]
MTDRSLTNPPVVEAVAGIEFRPRGLDVVGLVRETSAWMDQYPDVTAQPTLPPSRPSGQSGPEFEMQFVASAPPTRLWSTSPDKAWLVQTQDDRLLLNWRRTSDEAGTYPGFDDAIRPRMLALIGELAPSVDGEGLIPLIAEFSYVNRVPTSESGLHAKYAPFRQLDTPVPGTVIAEGYEVAAQVVLEYGTAQVTASIQPAGEPNQTVLTVSTKLFATTQLITDDTIMMIDDAHKISKQMFFAVVSSDAINEWEA